MKFLSGTRNRSICYVIEPSRPFQDMTSGRYTFTPPLRAKFKDHRFDSEAPDMVAQCKAFALSVSTKENPVTADDIKARVEKHLLDHKDFGRGDGRGLFIDNSATLTEKELKAKGVKRRCIFMQDIGGETLQCETFVEDDGEYCETHEGIVLAAVQGKEPANVKG